MYSTEQMSSTPTPPKPASLPYAVVCPTYISPKFPHSSNAKNAPLNFLAFIQICCVFICTVLQYLGIAYGADMGMEIRLGVLYADGIDKGVVRVQYDSEQAYMDRMLMSKLVPASVPTVGSRWKLRLICWCLIKEYGQGRLYDAGQISDHIHARKDMLERTVFVPSDQTRFFSDVGGGDGLEDTEDME